MTLEDGWLNKGKDLYFLAFKSLINYAPKVKGYYVVLPKLFIT